MRIDPFVIKTWNQAGISHDADFTMRAAQALYEIMLKIYGDRAAEEFRIAVQEEAEREVEMKLRGKRDGQLRSRQQGQGDALSGVPRSARFT